MKEESGSIVREHGKSVWAYVDVDLSIDGEIENVLHMHTGFGIMPDWIANRVVMAGTIPINDQVIETLH